MENKSLKQIIANRLEKLDKIRQLGVNPYPYEFNITHSTSEITKDNIDQNVSLAGRVMSLRKMGKAAFANIQDEKGRVQLYIARDDVGEDNYNLFKLVDIGDFIGINGIVFITKTEAITVKAEEVVEQELCVRPVVAWSGGRLHGCRLDEEAPSEQRAVDHVESLVVHLCVLHEVADRE